MRSHQIEKFIVRLARDPQLYERIEALSDDIHNAMKVAAEVGVPFTVQEYNEFLSAFGLRRNHEENRHAGDQIAADC